MNREQKPSKTISLKWIPTVYPTRWAELPDEVPNFDPSRGMPLDFYDFDLKKGHDITAPPTSGYPRLVRVSPVDPQLEALELIETEGVLEEDLVTENEFLNLGSYTPVDMANEDVIGDIVTIATDAWLTGKYPRRLKNTVYRLAQKYGPPYRHEENTLAAWKKLAIEVRTELWLCRELQVNDYELAKATMVKKANGLAIEILRESSEQSGPPVSAETDSDLGRRMLPDTVVLGFSYRGDPDDMRYIELSKLLKLWTWARRAERVAKTEGVRLAEAFRRTLAEERYNDFGRALNASADAIIRSQVVFTAHGIRIDCTLSTWLDYKLSEMWRTNQTVAICPICGSLFPVVRKNRKYCRRGSCADKHYRNQRQRAHENG
jgi:hypothetical protein